MALVAGPPSEALQRDFDRFIGGYPGVTVLGTETTAEHLEDLRRALAPVALNGDLPFVMVRSRDRLSRVQPLPAGTLIVDDELRRDTHSSLESYVFMRDRPLTAWAYLALVYAEMASVGGLRDAAPLIQCLLALSHDRVSSQTDPRGFVPRPQLQLKRARVLKDGEDRGEVLSVRTSRLYPSLHEIGHWIFDQNPAVRRSAVAVIRGVIEAGTEAATIGDMGSSYWITAEMSDPRWGKARLTGPGQAEKVRTSLRAEVVEEVFCDWFGLTALLADDTFAELPALTLVEVVQRHLVWNQLFLDARRELAAIDAVRKRWRTPVYDATSLRQQILGRLLGNPELTRLLFEESAQARIVERVRGFEPKALAEQLEPSLTRRHYLRFLGLQYPLGEELFVEEARTVAAFYNDPAHHLRVKAGQKVVWHQPAEWGFGDPERIRAEATELILRGRLDRLDLEAADDVEWFCPYLQEAYGLLSHLRRRDWVQKHSGMDTSGSSQASLEEAIDELGRLSRFSRLSHLNWDCSRALEEPNAIPEMLRDYFLDDGPEAARERPDGGTSAVSPRFVSLALGQCFHLPTCPTIRDATPNESWADREIAARTLRPCRVCKP